MPDEEMGEGTAASVDPDAPQDVSEVDWNERNTVPGLEHLGKAIVDDNGIPSGSPANFEYTRGRTGVANLPDVNEVIAGINSEFAAQQAALDEGDKPAATE